MSDLLISYRNGYVPLLLASQTYRLPAVRDGAPSALRPGKTLTHDGSEASSRAGDRDTYAGRTHVGVGFSTVVNSCLTWTTFGGDWAPPTSVTEKGRRGEDQHRLGTVVAYALIATPSRSSSATCLDSNGLRSWKRIRLVYGRVNGRVGLFVVVVQHVTCYIDIVYIEYRLGNVVSCFPPCCSPLEIAICSQSPNAKGVKEHIARSNQLWC